MSGANFSAYTLSPDAKHLHLSSRDHAASRCVRASKRFTNFFFADPTATSFDPKAQQ
jgi:hypothetical protein